MKNFMTLLFAIILFIPFLSADAQLSQKNLGDDNASDPVGKEIEKFVDRLKLQWNFDNNLRYGAEG